MVRGSAVQAGRLHGQDARERGHRQIPCLLAADLPAVPHFDAKPSSFVMPDPCSLPLQPRRKSRPSKVRSCKARAGRGAVHDSSRSATPTIPSAPRPCRLAGKTMTRPFRRTEQKRLRIRRFLRARRPFCSGLCVACFRSTGQLSASSLSACLVSTLDHVLSCPPSVEPQPSPPAFFSLASRRLQREVLFRLVLSDPVAIALCCYCLLYV